MRHANTLNFTPHRGLRTERYKLIAYYYSEGDYWELFDLQDLSFR